MLQVFIHNDNGFLPLVLTPRWQVAKLNCTNEQRPENIKKIDKHLNTDEVFVLIKGRAVLITAKEDKNDFDFQTKLMVEGEIYNVPKGVWHNIALQDDAQVLIIEDRDTHLGDFIFHELSENEYLALQKQFKDL